MRAASDTRAMAEHLEIETGPTDDRIRHLRLDNPPHNVLTEALVLELGEAIDAADRDPAVDAIVLGSVDEPFCAGADLDELASLDVEAGNRWLTAYLETVDRLRETGKPTIAAVEGTCVAGGNELVMGCDLIVAGETARFGQPEVGVGSTAAGGGLQLLPLEIGTRRARELLLTGRLLDAEEAVEWGMINRAVEAGSAESEAVDLAVEIVENSSPQAYRVMKSVMKGWTNLAMHDREVTRELTATVWASEEFAERADAFRSGDGQTPRSFPGVRPHEE